jgi:hypothetical protein
MNIPVVESWPPGGDDNDHRFRFATSARLDACLTNRHSGDHFITDTRRKPEPAF